ncbi:MAG: hypothetical protein J0L53_01290 [Spirochaetes bacterium]|nr:hypothetical protein [Spirochaetota bacterium]MBX3722891.1 hypothetical protein [Turneriella sp.]
MTRWIFRSLFLCFSLGTASLSATVNFPALAGTYLTQAQTFDTKYTQFANSFSHYYGDAAAFASYLSAPNARDNLGKFPSLYVGFGVGVTFGKVNSMKGEVDSSIQSNVPSYLIAENMSFNFGVGINRSWDLRFSFFPNAAIAIPSSSLGSNRTAELKSGVYRARLGYHVLEGGFLKPGFTIAGFVSYTTGGLTLSETGFSTSSTDSSGNTVALSNVTTKLSTSWQYFGIGPEARFWYDLKFFHPFVGYSLGLQLGQYTTGLDVNGNIAVTVSSVTQNDTGSITISERRAAQLISHRLMFGFEISLLVLDIGVEAQVDLVNGLVGAAVGTALRF